MNVVILLKLLVAHFLGDFLFQSDTMCSEKESKNKSVRNRALTVHSLIQAVLAYLLVFDWGAWIVPVVIFVSHWVIDWVKVTFWKKGMWSFIADQVCHIFVIYVLWDFAFADGQAAFFMPWPMEEIWFMLLAYVLVLKPTSILIKVFLKSEKWIPQSPDMEGLPNAGKWIGYIERVLILTFIFTDNVAGIGFLLAAKSIFRFGELNRSKDIKITEYVLIGTFTSFAIATIVGFVTMKFLPTTL